MQYTGLGSPRALEIIIDAIQRGKSWPLWMIGLDSQQHVLHMFPMTIKLYRLQTGSGFVVRNGQGRALAYIYGKQTRTTAELDKLSLDEAELVAKAIARALSVSDPLESDE